MGDDERCIYEPYIHSGGEWAHVGEGTISEEVNIRAGESINELRQSYEATFELNEDARRLVTSFFRSMRERSKSRRKAISRSKRNNLSVKRCAHGRVQRTRRRR